MEIKWEQESVRIVRELSRQNRTVQIAMESVVPDTRDDIGRILSVRPEVYLKSKELKNGGAFVSGEASICILYMNETETAVSSYQSRQPFSFDMELPEADPDSLLRVRLCPGLLQSRVLNPRKVSVDLEIVADAVFYHRGSLSVSQKLPEGSWPTIHIQTKEQNCVVTTDLIDKAFSINEQLAFPEGLPVPKEILAKDIGWRIRDSEQINGKLLIRGEAELALVYLPEESSVPRQTKFTVPFSQLFETGDRVCNQTDAWIQTNSAYVELQDSFEGKKNLDLELHALMQLRLKKDQPIRYISDAYCNLMPCECEFERLDVTESDSEKALFLEGTERLDFPQGAKELLCILPSLSACSEVKGSLSAELIFSSEEGKMLCQKRNIPLEVSGKIDGAERPVFRLSALSWDRDGESFVLRAAAEGEGRLVRTCHLDRVSSIRLDEELLIDRSCYPSLTAVWAETESIWELAKAYHSAPEAILSLNENPVNRPIFVPKTKE